MITIRVNQIKSVGYSLLLINIIIFFLTWLRWQIGIPAVCLLLFGFYKLIEDIYKDQTEINISKKTLFLICAIMLAWTVVSGLGGLFPQKDDLHWRNAILHDLINYSWPVYYNDGLDSSLTYYIAFWLVPALIGKLVSFISNGYYGWLAANIAYAIYCACILSVTLLLIINYLKATSLRYMLLVTAVLILFSGMDIVPIILHQLGEANIVIGTHLEWWTDIQYSSNTTQLCWVFNQAVPAWLVTALFLCEKQMNHYAFLSLLLLPYGPLPFIGLFFIIVILILDEFLQVIKQSQISAYIKQIITMPNVLAIVVIFPIYYCYFFTNTAVSNNGFTLQWSKSYFYFILVEFFIYVLLIGRNFYKERLFRFSIIGLFYIPLCAIGNSQDFCMRVSIPLLFILMIYIMRYLLSNISFCTRNILQTNISTVLLIICLSLGAFTPLTEYRESYMQVIKSGENRIYYFADEVGTLGDNSLVRDNFITINASESNFFRYIAKNAPSRN